MNRYLERRAGEPGIDAIAIRIAVEALQSPGVFDPGVHRIIEGIATTATLNTNGRILDPAKARFAIPVPLLVNHSWSTPVGMVVDAKVTTSGLWFRARFANEGLPLLREHWDLVKSGEYGAVSVLAHPIAPDYETWDWVECTLAKAGANIEARLLFAAEIVKPEVVRLDGSTGITVYRDCELAGRLRRTPVLPRVNHRVCLDAR